MDGGNIMRVLLRAPLLTSSGYGVHSRQLMKWLLSKKDIDITVECLKWGQCSWLLNKDLEGGLVGEIISRSLPVQPGTYDITFQVQLPDEWDPNLGKINIGVTAAVETDRCNPKWVDACNNMSHVVVPSTFTKNVIKRSGILTTGISVIQEWYDPTIDDEKTIKKHENSKKLKSINNKFNFLVLGQLTNQDAPSDRKNLLNTLAALFDEFKENNDVGIVLKTSFGKGTTIDKTLTLNYLNSLLPKIRKGKNPLHLIHGNMTNEEICSLYKRKNIKAFAMATRGEGYGLPLIESAASGLPIIATRWSGHLEFLEADLFKGVDYKMVEIPKNKIDNRIFIGGTRWAEPDLEDFKRKAREVYENYKAANKDAKTLKENVCKNFNEEAIMRKYDDLLEKVKNK